MDVDWCLCCGRHIKPDTVYCSQQCRTSDGPSSSHGLCYIDESNSESHSESCEDDDEDVVYHVIEDAFSKPNSRWTGNGPEGIAAWAKDIPSGPPEPLTHDITLPSHSPPPRKSFTPPKLLLPYRQPLPPTLCMSTPHPTRPQPSVPITTPQQQFTSLSFSRSISEDFGSITTSGTESIATPSSLAVTHPLASDLPRKECTFGNLPSLCAWATSPSQLPRSSYAPTHRPLPPQRRRKADSASFTVLAKTHSTSALRVIPPPDETDESSSEEDDGIWWLSGTSGFHDEKSASKPQGSSAKIRLTGERGRRPVGSLTVDHPAYRARGRKLSRNIA